MSEPITHNFISAKTQSLDTSLVSKNEWNDGHAFLGGTNGQVLVYDSGEANNMRWTDGYTIDSEVYTITNPTVSPITQGAIVTITPTSAVALCVDVRVKATTTGAVAYTFSLTIDGVEQSTDTFTSADYFSLQRNVLLAAGTHNIGVSISSTGAVDFTGGFVEIQTFTVGL